MKTERTVRLPVVEALVARAAAGAQVDLPALTVARSGPCTTSVEVFARTNFGVTDCLGSIAKGEGVAVAWLGRLDHAISADGNGYGSLSGPHRWRCRGRHDHATRNG